MPISQHFVELLLVSTEAQPLKARCRGVKVLTLNTSPCPKHWIDARHFPGALEMVLGLECFRLWERHSHSQSSMLLRDFLRKLCFRIQALAVSLPVLDLSPSRDQNLE